MIFEIDRKKRRKISSRRYKYEKKFRGFRWSIKGLTWGSVLGVIYWGYKVYSGQSEFSDAPWIYESISFAIIPMCFFLALCVRVVAVNVSHGAGRKFSETLCIEDGVLLQAYGHQQGLGANALVEGDGRMFVSVKLEDIHELKINKKSGRIQFRADSRFQYYSDWDNKIIELDQLTKNDTLYFYDYYSPSLMDYLIESGIPYEEVDMKYYYTEKKNVTYDARYDLLKGERIEGE